MLVIGLLDLTSSWSDDFVGFELGDQHVDVRSSSAHIIDSRLDLSMAE